MLKRLILRNFQGHRKLIVDLERITTIIGRTDAGKSSIIRAIRWVAHNRPAGVAFIRHGQTKASVTIVAEKRKIKRSRTKSKNIYSIDGSTLKAFGSDVPKPVQEILNVTEENVQNQHDSPFWLSLPPGQMARALNAVVDLQSIDHALSHLGREHRETKTEIKITRERLKAAKAERDQLKIARRLDRQLKRVERAERSAIEARGKSQRLESTLVLARGTLRGLRQARTSARAFERVLGAGTRVKRQVDILRERTSELSAIINSTIVHQAAIADTDLELERIETLLKEYKRCPVCNRVMSSQS